MNAGRSRSDLKPIWTVNGEMARSMAAERLVRAAEVVEDDDPSAGPTDALHLAHDCDRVGHDADHVRRVDDVEGVVGKFEIGGVHFEQTHVADALAGHPVAGLLEHGSGEIDAGHRAGARVERGVDPGADAHLEHAIAGTNSHPLDRLNASRVQGRSKKCVVGPRDVLVDPFDEVVFDDRHRQRAGGGVRPDELLPRLRRRRLKDGHQCLRNYTWEGQRSPCQNARSRGFTYRGARSAEFRR